MSITSSGVSSARVGSDNDAPPRSAAGCAWPVTLDAVKPIVIVVRRPMDGRVVGMRVADTARTGQGPTTEGVGGTTGDQDGERVVRARG
jgi:hypothetical protein